MIDGLIVALLATALLLTGFLIGELRAYLTRNRTPMTNHPLDQLADRPPAPSAAWRTTWRDVIVRLLAPITGNARPPERRRDRRWQPLHERKTSYEVTE